MNAERAAFVTQLARTFFAKTAAPAEFFLRLVCLDCDQDYGTRATPVAAQHLQPSHGRCPGCDAVKLAAIRGANSNLVTI